MTIRSPRKPVSSSRAARRAAKRVERRITKVAHERGVADLTPREIARIAKLVATSSETRPTQPSIEPPGGSPGPTKPQGSDGVLPYGGWVVGGEGHTDLVGENLYRTISRVLVETAIVAAAVRYALNLIRGVEWESQPNPRASSASTAKEMADLVRDGLLEADMPDPWSTHVVKQSLAAWYGFSIHNWIWGKREDGRIVYADLQHRPQHTIKRWDIRSEGEPWRGIEQHTRNGGLYYMKRSRLWYTVDKALVDQPTGCGLLRHILESARRLNRLQDLEGYAYDANLRGIPIGRAPLGELYKYAEANKGKVGDPKAFVDSETAEISRFLQSHIKTPDQGLLLDSAVYTSNSQFGLAPSGPPQWAIDLLQGDDMGLAQIALVIERINREIARVMGCEFLLMGGGDQGGGNRAMHTDKTDMFGAFLDGILMMISGTARNDLARPLVAANKGLKVAQDATPILKPAPISQGDVLTLASAAQSMKNGGAYMPPDDPIWNHIRRRMGVAAQMKIPPEIRGALMRPGQLPGIGGPNGPGGPNGGQSPPNGPNGGQPSNANKPDEDTDELRGTDDEVDTKKPTKPEKRKRRAA